MSVADPIRIAMWSGPRNLSTAMMRSFGARADTVCVDEPFYAAYLETTGVDHPMRNEVLASQDTDPAKVAQVLSTSPTTRPVFYQKHMTHHMVPAIPRDWMAGLRHAFLIRHPARVLASYAQKMEAVSLEAIGFTQQAEIYDHVSSLSDQPPVIVDAERLRANPEHEIRLLCKGLGIEFDSAMLSWQTGPKPEDGAWAPHWYDAVNRSSGFSPPSEHLPVVPALYTDILERALVIYQRFLRQVQDDGTGDAVSGLSLGPSAPLDDNT
ncbi:MAG: HAD family hydrolase [Pseudomonadota bacterium]